MGNAEWGMGNGEWGKENGNRFQRRELPLSISRFPIETISTAAGRWTEFFNRRVLMHTVHACAQNQTYSSICFLQWLV